MYCLMEFPCDYIIKKEKENISKHFAEINKVCYIAFKFIKLLRTGFI